MRLSIAVALAGWLICGAAPAIAQTHPTSGVFVHGGVFASIERLPHVDTDLDAGPFADPSGTVFGGTFGVGGFLTSRLTARLEVALPGELEAEDEETVGPIRASGQTEILLRDVYVMLGYETDPGRRIRLSYLAGAVVRQRRIEREATITTQPPIIPPLPIIPPIRRFEESIVSYETSLALGLDAAAMMTDRLALVRPDAADEIGEVRVVGWEQALALLAPLLERENLYPVRYRTRGFPSDAQLAQLRAMD